MIFQIGAFRRWLNFGVQGWEFNFEGSFSLGVSSDDEWCWILFLQWSFS